jgi:hypothetical protein
MVKSAVVRLQDILRQEREAALNGNLNAFNDLGVVKEAALNQLPAEELSAKVLRGLSEDIMRNQIIIESVIAGVRSAQRQMQLSEMATSQTAVYNKNGRLEQIDFHVAQGVRKY